MRFSDDEWESVTRRADDAGLALGAWIGQIALDNAGGHVTPVGLPDLLRLHSDVVGIEGRLLSDGDTDAVGELIRRLDVAVDAVVAEIDRGRR